jgi:8-hydroxy-5-deazaflavin:NADPH oxidoreductase
MEPRDSVAVFAEDEEIAMRIAIIGAGNVGQALGVGWRKCGHDVSYALRAATGKNADTVAAQGFRIVAVNEAAHADVVVLAMPWSAVAQALQAAGSLAGKIVIDATNPLTPELELALGFNDSAGETVARLAPGARVVKAFNTTGAGNMATAHAFPAKPMMPLAGDDAEAKAIIAKLAEDLGFEAVDAGPLKAARLTEPLAMFWIKLAYAQRLGRNFAFSLIRREP